MLTDGLLEKHSASSQNILASMMHPAASILQLRIVAAACRINHGLLRVTAATVSQVPVPVGALLRS